MAARRKSELDELKSRVGQQATHHTPTHHSSQRSITPLFNAGKANGDQDPAAYARLMAAREAANQAADMFNEDVMQASQSIQSTVCSLSLSFLWVFRFQWILSLLLLSQFVLLVPLRVFFFSFFLSHLSNTLNRTHGGPHHDSFTNLRHHIAACHCNLSFNRTLHFFL